MSVFMISHLGGHGGLSSVMHYPEYISANNVNYSYDFNCYFPLLILVKICVVVVQLSNSFWRSSSLSSKILDGINYSFVYVTHPQAVTGFSWRHTSKYMNR
jgi:hypothetical protein